MRIEPMGDNTQSKASIIDNALERMRDRVQTLRHLRMELQGEKSTPPDKGKDQVRQVLTVGYLMSDLSVILDDIGNELTGEIQAIRELLI